MSSVLLQPHQDDAVLFAAFTCWREKPFVVTVLQSYVQALRGTGITNEQRRSENAEAMGVLGCSWVEWGFRDDAPDWDGVRRCIEELAAGFDHCYAPAVEDGGHDHHNQIGRLAADVFPGRTTYYMTYTNGRTRTPALPVAPTPGAVAAKLRALSCFTSQINEPSTGHHFLHSLEEWTQ